MALLMNEINSVLEGIPMERAPAAQGNSLGQKPKQADGCATMCHNLHCETSLNWRACRYFWRTQKWSGKRPLGCSIKSIMLPIINLLCVEIRSSRIVRNIYFILIFFPWICMPAMVSCKGLPQKPKSSSDCLVRNTLIKCQGHYEQKLNI